MKFWYCFAIFILVSQCLAYTVDDKKEVDIDTIQGTDIKKVIKNDDQRIIDRGQTKDAATFYLTQDGMRHRAYIDYTSNGVIVLVKPHNPYLSKDWLKLIVASFKL